MFFSKLAKLPAKVKLMLKRFNVLNSENDQALEGIDYPVLLNLNQIASIKCINIMYKGNIIQGFWIRMVSGKKYKATRVPREIKALQGGAEDSQRTMHELNERVLSLTKALRNCKAENEDLKIKLQTNGRLPPMPRGNSSSRGSRLKM